MKSNWIYLALISLLLCSCNGQGSSSGSSGATNTEQSAVRTELTLPNSQKRTTASLYTKVDGSNNVVSTSGSMKSLANSTMNSCFAIQPQSDGKTYKVAINSSQWWSTAKISFSVKNTCETLETLENLPIVMNSVLLNGKAVSDAGQVYQNGPSYLYILSAVKGNSIDLSLSTAPCVGEWCSWAKVPPGGIYNFEQVLTQSGPINSLDLASVTIGGVGPTPNPTPDVSPTPPPNPESTGSFDVTVDSRQIKQYCKTNSCDIKVSVVGNDSVVYDTFKVNPNASVSDIHEYKNVFPGKWVLSVVESSLPIGVNFNYLPKDNGSVEVTPDSKSDAYINFTYKKPEPTEKYGDLNINLANIPESSKFVGLTDIKGRITDTTENRHYEFSVNLGGSYNLRHKPESHSYNVSLQGIASAKDSLYYKPISATVPKLNSESTTNLILSYIKDNDLNNVAFKVSGDLPSGTKTIKFANDNLSYIWVDNLLESANYGFIKDHGVTTFTIYPPADYSVTTSTNVISSETKTVDVIYKKKNVDPTPPTPTPTPTNPVNTDKVVTVYLLIDTPAQLKQYTDDLARVNKVNFNRVIFSFVRPTLPEYTKGNLSNTGIMGYFGQGDGKGVEAFNQLKDAVKLSKAKHIQAFISVGGWNYSCNYQVYGDKCGDASANYDWFPDPNDSTQKTVADKSYANIIHLVNDLGAQGIDLDAEEFWHADEYAVKWNAYGGQGQEKELSPIVQAIQSAGGPTYDNLMEYGAGGITTPISSAVMPKTVDKMAAIMHALEDNPNATNLLFSTAAPPVGARPITGFVYGDNLPDIYNKGGVWWLGNLKGLWYNLTDKDKAIVDRFDSIGLMTYDLCSGKGKEEPGKCAPYGNGPLDLAGQVNAYMQDYSNWLKSSSPRAASLEKDESQYDKFEFLPAKYNIASKIQFGFEVNQPAYPRDDVKGQLPLTNDLVRTILDQQKNSDGVIIWQLYSKKNESAVDATTSRYTISQSCKTFLSGNAYYNCDANFPAESAESALQ